VAFFLAPFFGHPSARIYILLVFNTPPPKFPIVPYLSLASAVRDHWLLPESAAFNLAPGPGTTSGCPGRPCSLALEKRPAPHEDAPGFKIKALSKSLLFWRHCACTSVGFIISNRQMRDRPIARLPVKKYDQRETWLLVLLLTGPCSASSDGGLFKTVFQNDSADRGKNVQAAWRHLSGFEREHAGR